MKCPQNSRLKIAVIGGGWFGCHTAAEIKKAAPNAHVVIFERNKAIFSEVSGKFGIRLHSGPHYPRSRPTRVACHEGFKEFLHCYPELANEHLFSDYAHGILDSSNQPPKVSRDEFASVCQEFGNAVEVDRKEREYSDEIDYVVNIHEPSLILGQRLRQFFYDHLTRLGVSIKCNFEVRQVRKTGESIEVEGNGEIEEFDHVINATCYQSLLPSQIQNLISGQVRYYAVTALVYEYTMSPLPQKPFSFIVMDGSFPCLMPYDDRLDTNSPLTKYILSHGKLTILGEYDTPADARALLSNLNDEFMDKEVRVPTEAEMTRFSPRFTENFEYVGWKGTVLPKIESSSAFRSSITFQEKSSGMIYIFPGKINNIFDSAREALSLIGLGNGKVLEENEFAYVEGGILHSAIDDIGVNAKNKVDLIYDENNNVMG